MRLQHGHTLVMPHLEWWSMFTSSILQSNRNKQVLELVTQQTMLRPSLTASKQYQSIQASVPKILKTFYREYGVLGNIN
jgi:hypothetical protein